MAEHTSLTVRLTGRLDALGKRRAFGDTSWVGCVAWGLYGAGERYPVDAWNEMDTLEFEGHEFPVIGCWDEYLKGIYGNYMQLPPKEKRVAHGVRAWRINR